MNLKTIGDKSFANCTSLENVTILALYPPYLEGDPFSGIAKTKFPTFYIPRNLRIYWIYTKGITIGKI